jgi:hypothetical protein
MPTCIQNVYRCINLPGLFQHFVQLQIHTSPCFHYCELHFFRGFQVKKQLCTLGSKIIHKSYGSFSHLALVYVAQVYQNSFSRDLDRIAQFIIG